MQTSACAYIQSTICHPLYDRKRKIALKEPAIRYKAGRPSFHSIPRYQISIPGDTDWYWYKFHLNYRFAAYINCLQENRLTLIPCTA